MQDSQKQNSRFMSCSKFWKKSSTNLLKLGLVLALLIFMSWMLIACKSDKKLLLEEFKQAISEANYSEADEIFGKAKLLDDKQVNKYVDVVKIELARVLKNYENSDSDYDSSVIELEALILGNNFKEFIKPAVDQAIAQVKAVDDAKVMAGSAASFADEGEYLKSLELYNEALKLSPENAEYKKARDEVKCKYLAELQEEARVLIDGDLPRSALLSLEYALELAPNDEKILALQKDAKELIEKKEEALIDALIGYEINEIFASGSFDTMEKRLKDLKEKGVDVSAFETKLDEMKQNYINKIIAEAKNLAGSLGGNHWESNPYQDSINKLNEGLARFPENESLLELRTYYEENLPDNVANNLYGSYGHVNSSANGKDATGYEHDSSKFNRAIYIKPDAGFKFNSAEKNKIRMLVIPQTDNTNVYNNMQFTVKINGETVYEKEVFSGSTEGLLFEYDVSSDSEIEIFIQQSGFASFFDNILGRNGIFIEAFKY